MGEQQRVEILKLLARGAQILILDEPTAVLSAEGGGGSVSRAVRLVDDGHTAIVVTHKLDEGHGGRRSRDRNAPRRDRGIYVAQGRTSTPSRALCCGGDVPLETRRLERHRVEDSGWPRNRRLGRPRAARGVSFRDRRGEVLGVAGVEGNLGRAELVEVLTKGCAASTTER